jgi:hypothetical protein
MRRSEDEKRRCEEEKMWGWENVKMRRCEDEKMWRWEDVNMRRCEDVKMWGWYDVRIEDVMWRWEDVKMFDRPLLLEEPFAQTRSGKRSDKYQIVSIWLIFVHAWRGRIRGVVGIFWNWLRGGSCCACWSCWFLSQMYSIWWNNVEPFLCFLYMFFVLRSHNVTRCHLPSGSIYHYLN